MTAALAIQILTLIGLGGVIQTVINAVIARKKTNVDVIGVKADNAGKVSDIAIKQIDHINKRIADFQPQLAEHQKWDRGIVEQNRRLIRMLESNGIKAAELDPLRYDDPPSLWL
jgi:NAD kinase